MDHYKPPSLFRQNAIRNMTRSKRNFSTESWMWDLSFTSEIINKSCCNNNQSKIASNYWKVLDDDQYLTSISINRENDEQIAISSNQAASNLFIYQMNYDDSSLIHQQTITLPYISKLNWLNYDKEESLLLSGHKNGIMHLTSIPSLQSSENAHIIKRFNHKKHFTSNRHKNLAISQINIHQYNKVMTLCSENIFLWDIEHRSDLPILKNQNLGMLNLDSSPVNHGIIAVAGTFGVAINDLRASLGQPSIFKSENGFKMSANNIKWAPYDSSILAASHLDGTVRLWDIRAQDFFGELKGHNDIITSLQWSDNLLGDLYSGSRDGNIIYWNLDFEEDLSSCCLNGGLDSINYYNDSFMINDADIYKVINKRQCGTLIHAAKDSIIEIVTTQDKVLSIDGDSFLGVHYKKNDHIQEGVSDMIMEELLESLSETKEQEAISSRSSDEESSIFDKETPLTTPTMVDSIDNYKQQSITLLMSNSEGSLPTLIDDNNKISEKDSDSIIHENLVAEYEYQQHYQNIKPFPSTFNDHYELKTPNLYLI